MSYDEMLELASLGAGVMHSRSIEFAKKFSVPIHVRSSLSDTPGTMIVDTPEIAERPVSGAALTKNEARITVSQVPDVPGTSYEIFSRIAARHVTVDMIVQNIGHGGKADISFTVPRDELDITLAAVNTAKKALGEFQVSHNNNVSKISVVGLGMQHQPGVADRMFKSLSDADINLQMITTSEIKISALVAREQSLAALRAVHTEFELDKEPASLSTTDRTTSRQSLQRDAVDVVASLQGVDMEELMIDDIKLDRSQGRITIDGLPDRPGIAAKIFREIGKAGILVDMIVQSHLDSGDATMSVTVPQDQVEAAVSTLSALGHTDCWKEVTSSSQVAKLSVSGIGLHSHTGVAIRMFRALAETKINVAMINTSEIRVNVVVEGAQAKPALDALKAAFADVTK